MSLPMPGDRIPVSASRTRDVDRMRADYRARRIPRGELVTPRRPGVVLAKNQTGADLGFGRPAMMTLQSPPLNPSAIPMRDWDAQKLLYRLVPSVFMDSDNVDAPQGVAITTEPIANGAIGEVVISGLAVSVVALGTSGGFRPGDGVVTVSEWGWGKQVSETGSENYAVIDLSYRKLVAVYEITGISGSDINATIDPGHSEEFASRVFDNQGIATWQTTGDKGQCEYVGNQWRIINPWCAE